jgi:hypothetical protein
MVSFSLQFDLPEPLFRPLTRRNTSVLYWLNAKPTSDDLVFPTGFLVHYFHVVDGVWNLHFAGQPGNGVAGVPYRRLCRGGRGWNLDLD